MKKQKILEYFEGTPDVIYDTDTKTTWHWNDDQAMCFGFFPVSIDNDYKFLVGKLHHNIGTEAAKMIMGKAIGAIRDRYESYIEWIEDQCYEKSYGLGRYWKFDTPNYPDVLCFWYPPSSDLVALVAKKLKINVEACIFVTEDSQSQGAENITVLEYIQQGNNGDDGSKEINAPFKIGTKVAELIRSYNAPDETWQSQKEKEGWKTLAQRNATIYQESKEGKEIINEYFGGNPDTLSVYDYTKNNSGLFGKINGLYNKLRNNKIYSPRHIKQEYYWNEGNTITFGYFQDLIDGEKVFKKLENGSDIRKIDANGHQDIVRACADSYIRNAKSRIGRSGYSDIYNAIMSTSACKGRLFLKQKVLTTWGMVSSARLKEIVNLLGIENPQEYYYVINKIEEYNLLEYINSNNTSTSGDGDEERFRTKIEDLNDKNLQNVISLVREYNSPSSKLVDKSKRLGNMTIAQYNSLIYQESKEDKKENINNMKNNKYQEEFSNYTKIMNEALQKGDFKAYEYVKDMLEEAIEDSKHEKELMEEMNTTNFGMLNHIFENELPTLIKTNKKAVRDVIKTIKEDKNLRSQFNFYNVIKEQYNSNHAKVITPDVALGKLVNIVCEEIDQKTIKKSNKKLRDVMIENNIIPSDFIDDESKKLYESGNIILTTKRTSNNMLPLAESYNNVCQWMDKHKDDKKKNDKDVDTLIEEFENKLKTNLNESEMSFVQEITDFRSPIAEKRKEKLFNKFKNECISKINDMLKEDSDNVELKGLSDQINEMTFDKNNIVKDIAKLLEIRDILMDD
jgi:hypothetical protein